MEVFSALRRLPRRTFLCIYILCAMFAACAFYTLYADAERTVIISTVAKDIATDNIPTPSNLRQALQNRTRYAIKSGASHELKGFKSRTSWTFTLPEAFRISSKGIHNKVSNIFINESDHNRTMIASLIKSTRYLYLDNMATPTSSSSSTSAYTSTSATPTDTCQTSGMKDSKLILLWTSFFGNWNYLPKERFSHCPRCRNCQVTSDRSRLQESDAVIFHARDMSIADLPHIRYPHQRWVFYCLESPPHSDFSGLQYMNHMFNWTMTYRADSDILAQYGTVVKVWPPRKLDLQSLQWSFTNKSKSVAWMSSHCPTHGGRDDFAKELKKYIDVDIYGTCGTTVCPPGATEKCLQEFAEKYKFFLAFENTLCKDYITEKFFRTLHYNIIPVVFGGANYHKFAPPGSFIDALSFKSPRHLAFFLTGVGKDFKLYSSYFRWRRDYSVTLSNQKECDLCSMLHRKHSSPSTYEDLRQWWVGKSDCKVWKPK
ncbi:alpha-(1,3)-fucosyltransferase C-like [Stegodyphus dumicola]|uniref:alpha-(1,3)-fucosyltransferase C-like n=1 Tax=Stegodyphus dumicola TaxID=202533 RepID=UPI0015A85C3C|nr:alpha-(1,3)-fucosyltransferase C-like [Stegodyphus dumicola]XP_035214498.1 alpha-(1,3)-fucosyltransferase C-like [Stegodyphus dumicola]XP_035214499.1 alpha-(1,3)-fucosyltransferase C-like [Stegodyphus dumicola]XP_035214500.1 alpha-(1,3)-fucosyltransferase C-like [Stegodyphus dumicola]XP_035214501.1 alpha-(1,3)-fucosyltransferase C-like [Stegodyphus dumicola]XP_035214502.1 alpha-(1,3)-fucosyltransferase C-like [Stegodyphus dumicola]